MVLSIPLSVTINWKINKKNILESKNKLNGKQVFKFSYNPRTKELLMIERPWGHMEMITEYGKHSFNDYVRGIWLKKKKIVYLRMHENTRLLKATTDMLRENGVPDKVRIIWGEAAEDELADEPDLQ